VKYERCRQSEYLGRRRAVAAARPCRTCSPPRFRSILCGRRVELHRAPRTTLNPGGRVENGVPPWPCQPPPGVECSRRGGPICIRTFESSRCLRFVRRRSRYLARYCGATSRRLEAQGEVQNAQDRTGLCLVVEPGPREATILYLLKQPQPPRATSSSPMREFAASRSFGRRLFNA